MEKITIRKPDDFHVHLRSGDLLEAVAPYTAAHFKRALVMPNTRPNPILTAEDAMRYKEQIFKALKNKNRTFEPLMTIQITDNTTGKMIYEAKEAGVIAGKVYPAGVTTNSDNGITDFDSANFKSVLCAMRDAGMALCMHGEDTGVSSLKKEDVFIDTIMKGIVRCFPRLKIVFEHITTLKAVEFVLEAPENVVATITVHHLFLTLDDVIGEKLQPHHFCKPIAKTSLDRDILRSAAMSGNPKFFLGTDSAPHSKMNKECHHGAAGVFTAPVALPLLAVLFEEYGGLDQLEKFASINGAQFYGLPLNEEKITLIKRPWEAPIICDDYIVPFKAGQQLAWQVY